MKLQWSVFCYEEVIIGTTIGDEVELRIVANSLHLKMKFT